MERRLSWVTALALGVAVFALDVGAQATPQCVGVAATSLDIESVSVDGVPVSDLSGYRQLQWALGANAPQSLEVLAYGATHQLVLKQAYVPAQ